jgi:DNA topoisomerase-1
MVRKMLTPDQYKLYKLIWERFVASQMVPAIIDTLSLDIECEGCIFRAGAKTVKSLGYMAIYDYADDEEQDTEVNMARLPSVKEGSTLDAKGVSKAQHFTEPPARYTEASLIKFLEENGIGRPSTYAPIISIIISRDYVRRDGKVLVGTQLGEVTTDFIKERFPEIADYEFTADLESKLDSIENGQVSMNDIIGSFWERFNSELSQAISAAPEKNAVKASAEESDHKCPKCGKNMIYKTGRFGRFLACPDYPACKSTVAVDRDGNPVTPKPVALELAGFECEICGADMVVRNGRYGMFYACRNYPECKFTKQKLIDTGVPCPICGGSIIARQTKENSFYYYCSASPECSFSSWDKPLLEKCPECGEMLYYRRTRRAVICKSRNCEYKREESMDEN